MNPTNTPEQLNARTFEEQAWYTAVYRHADDGNAHVFMPFRSLKDDDHLSIYMASMLGDTLGLKLLAILPGIVTLPRG